MILEVRIFFYMYSIIVHSVLDFIYVVLLTIEVMAICVEFASAPRGFASKVARGVAPLLLSSHRIDEAR